jgi:hypothetical protein
VELLVATWTVRLAFVAAIAVMWISLSAGSVLVDAVLRAAVAAFVFTLAGRLLIGFLERPDQRMHRLRAERAKRQGKSSGKSSGKSNGKSNGKSATLPAAADRAA